MKLLNGKTILLVMIRYSLKIGRHSGRLPGVRIAVPSVLDFKFTRFYSDDKYKSIDEFKKQKKDYRFGHNFSSLDELDEQNPKQFSSDRQSDSSHLHDKISKSRYHELNEDDVNSMIENDPRLINLKQGTADYKYQQDLIHREFQERGKKEQARYEFIERFKGVGFGILALIGIVSLHQIVMNYEYLKTRMMYNFNYNVDDSKVQRMDDPSKNSKNIDYLTNKLMHELNEDLVNDMENLSEVSGLYVFGSQNNHKFPFRFKFFDGMLIQDVQICQDYLAVINEKGQLYQYSKGMEEPVLTKLGTKVSKCKISNDMLYLLTNKGEVIFVPKIGKQVSEFEHHKSRNVFGISSTRAFNKVSFYDDDSKKALLERNESIIDITTGQSHLLMLSNKGKLFVANTAMESKNFMNYGQFGIPRLSPFAENAKQIPSNKAFELTLLNNEIISDKNGTQSIIPRRFDSIASGSFHNIVSDTTGGIWTWGKNTFGECGSEISYRTDFQPIPKKILDPKDIISITKNTLPDKLDYVNWGVEKVFAANESSYIKFQYTDKENVKENEHVLVSFGNGIKGQLGSSRFLHVCPQPQIVKSINNLNEFNESLNSVVNIGIKDVSIGNNHAFVTLNTTGNYKEVLSFGDNEFGQFGNGKAAKSSKPIRLPNLIEPSEFEQKKFDNHDRKSMRKLARKLNDTVTNRLQLLDGVKLSNGIKIQQVIFAGDDCSAIFYKRK